MPDSNHTTLADLRKQYPQYKDMDDGALADALHAKFYSDMPKNKFYAKIGYDPYSIKRLPHDLGQLAAGMDPTGILANAAGIPKAANAVDEANRTAGLEMLGALPARQAPGKVAVLSPPNFRRPSWTATAKGGPAVPAISKALNSPAVKAALSRVGRGAAYGAGGVGTGSGMYYLLHRLGLWP